jgi:hypothetical protein
MAIRLQLLLVEDLRDSVRIGMTIPVSCLLLKHLPAPGHGRISIRTYDADISSI